MNDHETPSETASTLRIKIKEVRQAEAERTKETIAMALLRYRMNHKLSVEELAMQLGVDRMQVWRWENKESKPSKAAISLLHDRGIVKKP